MSESWKRPSIESRASIEGEGKRLLHELEASGQYVFHGSPTPDITELEVRQPYDWKEGAKKEHGTPSVVATPYADIAIFRALVYRDSTGFGAENGKLHFDASEKALAAAKASTGYVYVLSRNDFVPKVGDASGMDWRSQKSQSPVRVVRVAFDDLPDDIRLIEKAK